MTSTWHTLRRRARRRFAGYPIASVAFYGPDDRVASKVAVGIVPFEGGEVHHLERWTTASGDVRDDEGIAVAALAFIRAHRARSIGMLDRIVGCPHEEGIDYPLGGTCPQCPFWEGRDRWAGLPVDDAGTRPTTPRPTRPTLVADLRHFLDEDGRLPDLPAPALNLALHLGAIVAWMTAVVTEGEIEITNVVCRRRPRGRRCRGQVLARFLSPDERIEWACPVCGDNGIIDGWAGTRWDRSTTVNPEDALLA